jgi:fructan beta-fructosidase
VCAEWENATVFYTSHDLKNWTKASTYNFGFECPDIFELAVDGGATKKWVILDAGANYHIGSFNGTTFTPDAGGPWKMDVGPDFYASQTFFRKNSPDNRVIQMAWMRGNLGTSPWTHEASFPCEIKLSTFTEGVRVTRNPIAEICSLYVSSQHWNSQQLSSGSNLFSAIKSKCFDVIAEFDLTGATATAINFTLPNRTVTYSISQSTLLGASLLPIGNRVKIRLLVDWGELEVFGNDGKFSWTQNVAFTPADSSIDLSVNGNVTLVSMDFHALKRTWPNTPFTPNFRTNLTGAWTTLSGTWADVSTGKQGSGTGDVFCLNSQTDADFTYEGDITLILGTAGALVFRANAAATAGYCVNIDASGLVKLWAPGRGELARYTTTIQVGVATYHLKVVTAGSNIRVYFNNGTTPVINYTDATPTLNGRFGLNIFNGTAIFQDVYRNGIPVNTFPTKTAATNRFSFSIDRNSSAGNNVRVEYSIPPKVSAVVSLDLFNLHGRFVRALVNNQQCFGYHAITFNLHERAISAGNYFCRFRATSTNKNGVLYEKTGNLILQQ